MSLFEKEHQNKDTQKSNVEWLFFFRHSSTNQHIENWRRFGAKQTLMMTSMKKIKYKPGLTVGWVSVVGGRKHVPN